MRVRLSDLEREIEMDKEQQIRGIVCRFLKERVDAHEGNPKQNLRFWYRTIDERVTRELGIISLDYRTQEFALLHLCINEMLANKILMQMFGEGAGTDGKNPTFHITPSGVKCLKGQQEGSCDTVQ